MNTGNFITKFGGHDVAVDGHRPGYLGYRPEEKFHYGRTFGDATAAYFQKKREETMKTSSVREAARKLTGIKQYPTANSHNPVLVLSARCKERRRLFETPKYTLSNTGVRDEEIDHFAKLARSHRNHHRDCGTHSKVDYFVLPENHPACSLKFGSNHREMETNKKSLRQDSPESLLKVYDKEKLSKICKDQEKAPVSKYNIRQFLAKANATYATNSKVFPKSTHRDREVRDVYFERR